MVARIHRLPSSSLGRNSSPRNRIAIPAKTNTASVTATVTCVVNLSDVAVPGLPGTRTITATMSSPLDTYRER